MWKCPRHGLSPVEVGQAVPLPCPSYVLLPLLGLSPVEVGQAGPTHEVRSTALVTGFCSSQTVPVMHPLVRLFSHCLTTNTTLTLCHHVILYAGGLALMTQEK